MNFVRNPKAKWLPSRHRFALARLIAFVRSAVATSPLSNDVALQIDRDQSTVEAYTASLWFVATFTCYLAPFVTWWLALPVTLIVIEFPMYATGLLAQAITGHAYQQRAVSIVLMTMLTAASAFEAMSTSWIRFVAWFALAIVAMNAVAAVVMFALRGRVRALEQQCGV